MHQFKHDIYICYINYPHQLTHATWQLTWRHTNYFFHIYSGRPKNIKNGKKEKKMYLSYPHAHQPMIPITDSLPPPKLRQYTYAVHDTHRHRQTHSCYHMHCRQDAVLRGHIFRDRKERLGIFCYNIGYRVSGTRPSHAKPDRLKMAPSYSYCISIYSITNRVFMGT